MTNNKSAGDEDEESTVGSVETVWMETLVERRRGVCHGRVRSNGPPALLRRRGRAIRRRVPQIPVRALREHSQLQHHSPRGPRQKHVSRPPAGTDQHRVHRGWQVPSVGQVNTPFLLALSVETEALNCTCIGNKRILPYMFVVCIVLDTQIGQ